MSEQAPENNQQNAQEAPAITFNLQYLKDLSFEAPNSPQIFLDMKAQPEITVNIDVKAMRIKDNAYTVSLITNSEAKIEGKTAFICECEFACVVSLNVPDDSLEQVLLVQVPQYLFPFARNIIADTTRNGGFTPLLLNPVDFMALYNSKKQQQQQRA